MKWLPQVTQTVRGTQDHPDCPLSLSFPTHEHISNDMGELWWAVGWRRLREGLVGKKYI